MTMIDHGGHVLTSPHVQLIYWGTYWAGNPNPTPGAISNAVSSIVTGSYMSSLNQYRGVGTGNVSGVTFITNPVGSCPANPPNPFSDTDVTNMMSALIYAGMVPSPSDSMLLYCFIMPPNVNSVNSNYIGGHGTYVYYAFPAYFASIHWAWVTNNGTLDDVTLIFSHELAEACSDSELSAWWDQNGNEIGDVCEGNWGRENNGVLVQAYWSNSDNACVLPTDKSIKDNKDSKDQKDQKDGKDHKERKEKEKDSKEKDRDQPRNIAPQPQHGQVVQGSGQPQPGQAPQGSQGSQPPAAHPFIAPEERPPVGQQALNATQDTSPSS